MPPPPPPHLMGLYLWLRIYSRKQFCFVCCLLCIVAKLNQSVCIVVECTTSSLSNRDFISFFSLYYSFHLCQHMSISSCLMSFRTICVFSLLLLTYLLFHSFYPLPFTPKIMLILVSNLLLLHATSVSQRESRELKPGI